MATKTTKKKAAAGGKKAATKKERAKGTELGDSELERVSGGTGRIPKEPSTPSHHGQH